MLRLIAIFLLILMEKGFANGGSKPYDDYLYMRGFLYTKNEPQILPERYQEIATNLWVDREVDFAFSPNDRICIFGLVVDLLDAETHLSKIACDLEKALEVSDEAFYDREESLCGRYAILYKSKSNEIRLLGDATANRAIYHSENGEIIAGHAKLVAENLAGTPLASRPAGPFFGDAGTCPGRYTPYEGVSALIPNTSLTLDDGEIKRFYPRKPFTQYDSERIFPLFEQWMANALLGIEKISEEKRLPLIISLTAGLDSRTSLAISKKYCKRVPKCFTYVWIIKDYLLAKEVCSSLQIPHDVIPSPSTFPSPNRLPKVFKTASRTPLTPEFEHLLRSNSYHAPDPQFAHNQELLKRYSSNRYIHIRSNAAEVGRDYMHKYAKGCGIKDLCTAQTLARLFPGNQGPFPRKKSNVRLIKQAMLDYIERTELSKAVSLGYSTRELYHWESNIGRRVAQLSILDDPIFDNFIPYNSRILLDAMLKVPHHDKIQGTLQRKTISYAYPELLKWPINPPSCPPSSNK